MLEKLERIFDNLQEIEIKATRNNMRILLGALNLLQEVYFDLKQEKEGARDERPEADPE